MRFYASYLKLALGAHTGAQKASKNDPKILQNTFKIWLEICLKLNADFEPNLAQLGGQVGLNLGPKRRPKLRKKGDQKSILSDTSKRRQNDPNMTPKWPQHDTQMNHNNFQKIYKRCYRK